MLRTTTRAVAHTHRGKSTITGLGWRVPDASPPTVPPPNTLSGENQAAKTSLSKPMGAGCKVEERRGVAIAIRLPSHRVTGGGRPPPVPTERGVRISRTNALRQLVHSTASACSSR